MSKNTPTISYSVKGLKSSAEILIDSWGVPHIYASSFFDAFFVQGFNAARDRLWQIDLSRRRGLGLLSEVFGPNYLEQDTATRLFLYRGDMHKEWSAYGSNAKDIATAFVNGVNEYVEIVNQNPDLMPWEFQLLGYKPTFWSPEDVVRIRSNGFWYNLESEVTRARIACQFGLEVDEFRKQLEPEWKTKIPQGLDPCSIPENVLHLYTLAKQGVTFTKESLGAVGDDSGQLSGLSVAQSIEHLAGGSNNWAISPQLTATGRPILASDPHRTLCVPSLRYIAHLVAPGLNVIGAGEPGLPGISIGHNDRIAFGLTLFPIDQEDLYVHQTNPDNPNEYHYKGGWEAIQVVEEEIPVCGSTPVKATLKFTHYGPVIYEDKEKHTAFSVGAVWLQPGMAPYFGSIQYMQATTWSEFLAAMNSWGGPAVNQVYADVDGNIGWKTAALAPIRPNWDGLLPVPGDGRYEWAGFYNIDEHFPVEYNPKRGWVATANQMNLPSDYPYKERKLGFDEWLNPCRYQRIAENLNDGSSLTLLDSQRLQTDFLSLPARRVVNLLQGLESDNLKLTQALEMLKNWDCVMGIESAPAALFEIWFSQYLCPAVMAKLVPPEAHKLIGAGDPAVAIDVLENPDMRLGVNSQALRNDILLSSLVAAIEKVEKTLGLDRSQWAWGKLHYVFLEHPLSNLVDEKTREQINIGPKPKGGNSFTVNKTQYRTNDFRTIVSASFRMILDVGNWDNSLALNMPGQSGVASSTHYKNLFPLYEQEQAFPLLYNREAIEKVVQQRIELKSLNL